MQPNVKSTVLDFAKHAISRPATSGCKRVPENHLKVVHVPGEENRSDVLTKPVPGMQMQQTMLKSGYMYLTNRSKGQLSPLK